MKFLKIIFLFNLFICFNKIQGQIPISSIPELQQIVVREVTSVYNTHIFTIGDPVLEERLGAGLSTNNDFGGVPGAENYDIFYSDAAGNLDANGSYITIECRFLGTSGGGGGNIAHLQLEFTNGYKISPSILASYYANGGNYIPGSELNAVDCNPNTFTTLGNNNSTPNTVFLRLTFDFSNIIDEVNLTACEGEGFQYVAGSYVFDESNPSGNAYINTPNGCNRLEIVDITFEPLEEAEFTYTGCSGDQFSITIGSTVFNELNPTGTAVVQALVGCDTLYEVNLVFEPYIEEEYTYTGCSGDQFFIEIGGTRFDEQNPSGMAIAPALAGCDTLYTVNLTFEPLIEEFFTYTGCSGDQYSITIGSITFDEQNPIGTSVVEALVGCDTLYNVELFFEPYEVASYNYIGCTGDQFSITLGSETFNEQNPSGTALVVTSVGCDTLYDVSLVFEPLIQTNFNYNGCTGDLFSVTLGGTTFNEQNPTGTAIVTAQTGCDTLYQVELTFDPLIEEFYSYTGCSGDGFEVNFGGTLFNEQNPSGTAVVSAQTGCDTLYFVDLTFEPFTTQAYSYSGCTGNQFSVTLGGTTFDEQNPTGTAFVPGIFGCDTLYEVNLIFEPLLNETFTYSGCEGDQFSIVIGGTLFNEQNPTGTALSTALTGCDTLYFVDLNFEPLVEKDFNYTGCSGDGFSITLGGITFDEQNPSGTALVNALSGCDTLYSVSLTFGPYTIKEFNYSGCTGNQYSIVIGGTTFDEQNTSGMVLVPGTFGCDTLYEVNLVFEPLPVKNFNYSGCKGDQFAITIGSTTFNESNPVGSSIASALFGCDTVYFVNLNFAPLIEKSHFYQGCSGDNYSITIGGITFNEQNPIGFATTSANQGCDTLYSVNLTFAPYVDQNYNYTACSGSQYSITLGGITFDEQNPIGTALVVSNNSCDTLYRVDLTFVPLIEKTYNYVGCIGDQFSVTIGNKTFNEQNPIGTSVVSGMSACDTMYNVTLQFNSLQEKFYNYSGCKGEPFSVIIGGITFNEQNPQGMAMVDGTTGCDTIYHVNLNFNESIQKSFDYLGCSGNQYEITIGGVTFNEQNPVGMAIAPGQVGCDTIYNVNLVFSALIEKEFNYVSCKGDPFNITIGGITFNEQNPSGLALKDGGSNCDTLIAVNLEFEGYEEKTYSYTGCSNDQFSVNLGGQIFDEQNPAGTVLVDVAIGCDTMYTVLLQFLPQSQKEFSYEGCSEDQFSVQIGDQTFNELNPIGTVLVPGIVGCDTVYTVNLIFRSKPEKEFNYIGCKGDQYSVVIGDQTFNESNPRGIAFSPGLSVCDTTYKVNLVFNDLPKKDFFYNGCMEDQFVINIGGVIFNETNPNGVVFLPALSGCDTLYNVFLTFDSLHLVDLNFEKCTNENFSFSIGSQIFNSQHPEGQVIVSSALGCDTIFNVKIKFNDCAEECDFYYSNIISINNPGQNNFNIVANSGCNLDQNKLYIFDRWGNLIHLSKNGPWDGTLNGHPCAEGVYIFIYEYFINGIQHLKKGDITLIR